MQDKMFKSLDKFVKPVVFWASVHTNLKAWGGRKRAEPDLGYQSREREPQQRQMVSLFYSQTDTKINLWKIFNCSAEIWVVADHVDIWNALEYQRMLLFGSKMSSVR